MTKKEFLSQAYVLNRKIELREKRIETLRCSISSTAINPDEVPIRTAPRSPFETMLLIVIDLENETKKEKAELERLKVEIWNAIHAIGNDRIEGVLELRYLAFKSWSEIAESYGRSLDCVYRLHREGMESIHIG